MKKHMIYLRSDLVTPRESGMILLSSMTRLTREICAGRPLPRAPTWHTLSPKCMWRDNIFLSHHAHWHDQRVRYANICSVGYF